MYKNYIKTTIQIKRNIRIDEKRLKMRKQDLHTRLRLVLDFFHTIQVRYILN